AGTLNGLGAKALVVGGVADHVHVLFSLNSTHCVADLVRETKKASSAWGKNRYEGFAWQSGYAAFTIHAKAIPTVASYIARQEQHHATLSSADELRQLLAEFDVAYDPQFFE
ncbi:MAG TPA: transposase, partial [Fimbriimonadaceae bacterium]|nr:transposase [Fimbriimonadaceae bacterium]